MGVTVANFAGQAKGRVPRRPRKFLLVAFRANKSSQQRSPRAECRRPTLRSDGEQPRMRVSGSMPASTEEFRRGRWRSTHPVWRGDGARHHSGQRHVRGLRHPSTVGALSVAPRWDVADVASAKRIRSSCFTRWRRPLECRERLPLPSEANRRARLSCVRHIGGLSFTQPHTSSSRHVRAAGDLGPAATERRRLLWHTRCSQRRCSRARIGPGTVQRLEPTAARATNRADAIKGESNEGIFCNLECFGTDCGVCL